MTLLFSCVSCFSHWHRSQIVRLVGAWSVPSGQRGERGEPSQLPLLSFEQFEQAEQASSDMNINKCKSWQFFTHADTHTHTYTLIHALQAANLNNNFLLTICLHNNGWNKGKTTANKSCRANKAARTITTNNNNNYNNNNNSNTAWQTSAAKKTHNKKKKTRQGHRKNAASLFSSARLKLCSTIFMYTKGQQSRAAHSQDSNHNFNRIVAWRVGKGASETEDTQHNQRAAGRRRKAT